MEVRSCEVNDAAYTLQCLDEAIAIRNIAFDEFGISGQIVGFAARMNAGLKVIEYSNLIASFEKQIYRVRSDKAGPTSHQNFAQTGFLFLIAFTPPSGCLTATPGGFDQQSDADSRPG